MNKISEIISEEEKMKIKLEQAIKQVESIKLQTKKDILAFESELEAEYEKELADRQSSIDKEINEIVAKINEEKEIKKQKFDDALLDKERLEKEIFNRFIKRNS